MRNLCSIKYSRILVMSAIMCLSGHLNTHAQSFILPDVPDTLTTSEKRIAYLSLHYWDYFDFSDSTLKQQPEVSEQAFVDFVSILPYTTKAQEAVDTLYSRALTDKDMFHYFKDLADKYLYEPASPMYNEDLYIIVLRALTDNPHSEAPDMVRARYQLETALKNRPGDIASDFSVICRDGRRRCLSKIKSEFILIYFNDPDCMECHRVTKCLSESGIVCGMLESGRLKLMSVCVEGKNVAWEQSVYPSLWIDGYDAKRRLIGEELYNLRFLPVLYLLDADKRVLLRNAKVDEIETRLSE